MSIVTIHHSPIFKVEQAVLYYMINYHVLYCFCCLHIKNRSDLYSVPSNIRTAGGPTDANASFRGHRLTVNTPKGYTLPKRVHTHCEKSKK